MEELGATMSSAEFSLWAAFDARDPIGDIRHDIGHGIVASTVANFAGKQLPDGVSRTPADYMPLLPKVPEEVEEPDPVEYFGRL